MIKEGKDGCICLYWNDVVMSSLPIGKNKWDDYLKESEKFILESMKIQNKNVREIVYYTKNFCELFYKDKIKNKRQNTEDHLYFQLSLLSLIRMNLIDFDDVCLTCSPRRPGFRRGLNQ